MPQTPILISISGGEAAGKTAVQAGLKSRLLSLNSGLKILTLHMSDYALPHAPPPLGGAEGVKGYDLERLAGELEGIVGGEADADVVIVEGRYMLCCRRLVEVASVKIFVDCDSDVRLSRKVIRESGTRSLDRILDEYVRYSKPAFEQAILPTKPISDIILPAAAEGPGLDLIAHGVMDDIKRRRGRQSLPGILASVSHLQLPLALSEVDLTTGAPSYYQTV
ncbi:P-loop containing nucleoside triphosphate hydrolase protein [Tuber magnatum]|uniref:P-loop containing nucleoside triphosphate hydrolase protein n=1 Tax=Tuber magnatum TaxID=42249 RepID=A0A317SYA8_9PEZI|nr:P-loop containing nucleoside triphosphate hydrolase protein [Tuber magnatum]